MEHHHYSLCQRDRDFKDHKREIGLVIVKSNKNSRFFERRSKSMNILMPLRTRIQELESSANLINFTKLMLLFGYSAIIE